MIRVSFEIPGMPIPIESTSSESFSLINSLIGLENIKDYADSLSKTLLYLENLQMGFILVTQLVQILVMEFIHIN